MLLIACNRLVKLTGLAILTVTMEGPSNKYKSLYSGRCWEGNVGKCLSICQS